MVVVACLSPGNVCVSIRAPFPPLRTTLIHTHYLVQAQPEGIGSWKWSLQGPCQGQTGTVLSLGAGLGLWGPE